jgi:hypothetical protein
MALREEKDKHTKLKGESGIMQKKVRILLYLQTLITKGNQPIHKTGNS